MTEVQEKKNRGRGKGSVNYKKKKWDIKITGEDGNVKEGQYCSIAQLNADLGINLKGDVVWRLTSGKRVDKTCKHGDNSFLKKYQHINIMKIT